MAKKITSAAPEKKDGNGIDITKKAVVKKDAAMVTQGEQGKTIIQNEVVAKIAGLAVREIEGVHKLVSFGAGQAVASIASSIRNSDMKDLGVHVEVGAKEAAVDVRIISIYGASIPAVSEAIRHNVTEKIEEMTGLHVVEVNVDVVDLYFPTEESDLIVSGERVE